MISLKKSQDSQAKKFFNALAVTLFEKLTILALVAMRYSARLVTDRYRIQLLAVGSKANSAFHPSGIG